MAEARDAEGWPLRDQPLPLPQQQPPPQQAEAGAPGDGDDATAADEVAVWPALGDDLPAVRGAHLEGADRVARGLQVCIAAAVVLEVVLQLLALFSAPSPMRGRSVDLVVTVCVASVGAATTALQLRASLRARPHSRSELAAALLQVRPALLLWRCATGARRGGGHASGATAGLEQLSPELHRLSMAEASESREAEAAPGATPSAAPSGRTAADDASDRRRHQQEQAANASVGIHALLRTIPIACLLALRWWASLSMCLPACGTAGAVPQDDGGAVSLIGLSLFSASLTLSLTFTRCCAGELRARAERQPRADPLRMPGLTFAVLLLGVLATLWISTIVRIATFSLYVVVFGDAGALTSVITTSLLTVCFFQYEKNLDAFLGTLPGTTPYPTALLPSPFRNDDKCTLCP
jgi:hypothetical protein